MPEQMIEINGKNYPLIENTDPRLGVGYVTQIYQDPSSRKVEEDIGVIVKILRIDDEWIRADMEFQGDDGPETYQRLIWRMESIVPEGEEKVEVQQESEPSQARHTQGQLQVSGYTLYILNNGYPQSNRMSLCIEGGYTDDGSVTPRDELLSDVNRLRDCWNACEEINPEAVPLLLEAATKLVHELDNTPGEFRHDPELETAVRAAVALARKD